MSRLRSPADGPLTEIAEREGWRRWGFGAARVLLPMAALVATTPVLVLFPTLFAFTSAAAVQYLGVKPMWDGPTRAAEKERIANLARFGSQRFRTLDGRQVVLDETGHTTLSRKRVVVSALAVALLAGPIAHVVGLSAVIFGGASAAALTPVRHRVELWREHREARRLAEAEGCEWSRKLLPQVDGGELAPRARVWGLDDGTEQQARPPKDDAASPSMTTPESATPDVAAPPTPTPTAGRPRPTPGPGAGRPRPTPGPTVTRPRPTPGTLRLATPPLRRPSPGTPRAVTPPPATPGAGEQNGPTL